MSLRDSFVGIYHKMGNLVIKYWADRGASKFTIFKFCLKQLQGQPPLTTKQVQYCKAHVPNRIAELHGLVCQVEDKKPLSFQPPI
ncbi:histone-lysine N-methyltransferase, H3 lysine-9 specific SUVH4-like isoform X5 [Papaver somniferum]|nr:histone-lysine N-methyltransferase, H3 lysine-9 specific SUVH4-like isoform X5 [Papaver somniferum]XP_026388849.1 histone-lysine N-methyltransferase, H3 lysine-9 specific SUVH4-like isoform X5 [Papaver somniferum]